ncbi:hypothetical protein C5T94_15540 [Raoultella ornithinolytica]|jgi:hypothetical protein|uniref:Uncharacterized protein n=1 Tax=Raoultella ornithinolytica TaxID=54291 RepID=A0A855F3B4_RAOOR|nr:hypothetical protein HY59_11455 [Raoultella ornithinolytica]AXC30418.1 hypothetical protein DSD31_13545 [Raoultella sp. X13]KAJ96243.1 hypothetical protein DF41_18785 [Raoultella planticola]ASI60966.1 hypothetical protein CA210_23190 [Raoultella ornithinolytica]ATM21354.1 hypothetical protein CRN13_13535 [Raoultella ornithinolytica]
MVPAEPRSENINHTKNIRILIKIKIVIIIFIFGIKNRRAENDGAVIILNTLPKVKSATQRIK